MKSLIKFHTHFFLILCNSNKSFENPESEWHDVKILVRSEVDVLSLSLSLIPRHEA